MDENIINGLRTIMTVVAFFTFVGIVWWACARKNKDRFNEAENLPFSDEDADRAELGQLSRDEQRKIS
ncbi:MAG: cbb3-type cytochrome c oxidase subunit 3 [Betaproteobacteria bacterium]|nr:cbb3-type cytochrome c oxidase subunit 3 [Betaproteobacteria bacterium]